MDKILLTVPRLPTITTIENCMKLCPMIVQGLGEFKNSLLQLPHITEDNLKYFHAKKVSTQSCDKFLFFTMVLSSLIRKITNKHAKN